MKFSRIIKLVERHIEAYKMAGFVVTMSHDDYNYAVRISRENREVIIRDGWYDGKGQNKKAPAITSFDVLFVVNGITFFNFVSDYELSEYEERLSETFVLIDSFFSGDYDISEEKYLIFWRKKYLNIPLKGDTHHFMEVNRSS